jgi:hypothetical protein
MKFNFFKKQKSEYNYMVLTPVQNHKSEVREDGMVNVLIPKFKSEFAKKLFAKSLKSHYIKANLDEFGTSTWNLIDGLNNVEQIGKKLIEEFGENIEPVYERLTTFLTNLHRYNFIKFKELSKGQ